MKRYCQTLTLVDDEEMIAKYVEAHKHVWPEIIEGQRQVGILDMQIYRKGRQLFMICDTVDDLTGSGIWRDWRDCPGKQSGRRMWPSSKDARPMPAVMRSGK